MSNEPERDLRRQPLISLSEHQGYLVEGFTAHEPFDDDELFRVLQELGIRDFRKILEYLLPTQFQDVPRCDVSGLSYSRTQQRGQDGKSTTEFLMVYFSALAEHNGVNSEGVVACCIRYEGTPETAFEIANVNLSGALFGTEFARWDRDQAPWEDLPLPSVSDPRGAFEEAAAAAVLNQYRSELFISYELICSSDATEWERCILKVDQAKLSEFGFSADAKPAGISEAEFEEWAASDAQELSDSVFAERGEEGILEVSEVLVRVRGCERTILVLFHASSETESDEITRDAAMGLQGRMIYYQWMNYEAVRRVAFLQPYRFGAPSEGYFAVMSDGTDDEPEPTEGESEEVSTLSPDV